MIDPPKYPPRGYKPFEIEYESDVGWVCATPHCDDPVKLVEGVWVKHPEGAARDGGRKFVHFSQYGQHEPVTYHSRERIPAFFRTEEEAVAACWDHARHWWGGEPPSTWAVPLWRNKLPAGYRIFVQVEEQSVWLVRPDGTRLRGPVQIRSDIRNDGLRHLDTRLWSAMEHFSLDAFQEVANRQIEQQQDDARERVRAWVQDDEPRRWSLQRSDDGDFHPGLPDGHCVEMRIYMPYEMVEDVEAIMRHTQEPRMGVQGHCKRWIEDGIRSCAGEAQATIEEEGVR